MNRIKIALLALTTLVSGLISAQSADVGIYDPNHTFDLVAGIKYEQIWTRWDRDTPETVLAKLKAIVARGRTPILSIDPYVVRSVGTSKSLLGDIVAGRYDKIIDTWAVAIESLGTPVAVRWGPEMERDIEKPWSAKAPADYIAAFQHFVTEFRAGSSSSTMIWSPIGNPGCEKYYPGNDFVDFVGFSVYEYPQCTKSWFGQTRSFATWMGDKYPPLAKFGKPMIIVEMGIYDTPENQRDWVKAAFNSLGQFPLVQALIYYNAKDPVSWKPWGGNGAPNWMIDPAVFKNSLTVQF